MIQIINGTVKRKNYGIDTYNSVRQCADWLVQNNICQLNNCKNHINYEI